eukprot:gnl/TRDRNA2_/TRDRNA2_84027_c0_seq1.p1 gnl/TRDRNA2_/TRDRNA2_84027_c0~~gnl/TRDRNA2_/TRDRNA2_84027_c0_seq1.p1  ORF type:complete len:306 (+),score=45.66 gnl/TRDRNA2_/TRDRNA2_84027_c0_seq1:91-918(+)
MSGQQVHPSASEHSEHQYEGMLKGIGVTSKEPICGTKASATKRIHMATHFAIGCRKWDDDGARASSSSHKTFTDPGVVYTTTDAPYKNGSIIDLRQMEHNPYLHYSTEQRQRFEDPGPMPLDPKYNYNDRTQVHLGDDHPELLTQTAATHFRPADEEAQRAASRRLAGQGSLIPTSVWAKAPRCNPITGGARTIDAFDLGVMHNRNWPRISGNTSALIDEPNIRNPILGVHTPLENYKVVNPNFKTTEEIVNEANSKVPHLRTLGALRGGGGYDV